VGAGFGVALATLLGCDNPTRPTFPQDAGPDTAAPTISVVSPPPNTVVTSGTTETVQVLIKDRSKIMSVACTVSGVLSFAFPPANPDDSVVNVAFPIPTPKGMGGTVTLTISASDALDNGSTTTFAFVVK